jgi:hypothetical protein
MIVVRVELHSAITGEIQELALMHIANDGSGSARRGNYSGETFIGRSREALAKGRISKRARIEDWPRLDLHVWNLVATMLNRMGYGR